MAAPAKPASPWTAMAADDLDAIHDILRDNHPGPVDPQNPRYRQWLEQGRAKAQTLADKAASFSDYRRALLFYTNGFQDTHILPRFTVAATRSAWPGFLVRLRDDGAFEVVEATDWAPVKHGLLLACDGTPAAELAATWVEPYYWNSAVPHERGGAVPRLLMRDADDDRARFAACRFQTDAGEIEAKLEWRGLGAEAARTALDRAGAVEVGELGVRKVDEVWFVSVPSFDYFSTEDVARFRGFLAELAKQAPTLRREGFVVDVRGNRGGNGAWAREVVIALWGSEWLARIEDSFDSTVDWRASPANLASTRRQAELMKVQGLTEAADYRVATAALMEQALKAHQPLARQTLPGKPPQGAAPADPVTGKVYFLTDYLCDSACIDFADVLRRLPGVVHVGLPTDADAAYIDNTTAPLPSGLGVLSYSLKVYRHRVRGNNEWYEPQVRWPGGAMTEPTVARWIHTLDRGESPPTPPAAPAAARHR